MYVCEFLALIVLKLEVVFHGAWSEIKYFFVLQNQMIMLKLVQLIIICFSVTEILKMNLLMLKIVKNELKKVLSSSV